MSTNQLYIFSKDTDATATEQGYYYQKLKTIKTWLENRIRNVQEILYCDLEDDIFQRNFVEGTSKFRQIKLYSSNFSFSTEEIQKSLANFFILFTKGDYLFDEASFVFETNSSIARETRGNDGNLLKEWHEHQDEMSDDLISRCKTRVKTIIDAYIQDGYTKQMAGDTTGDFLRAKTFYESLPDDFWDGFIKSIRWQFENVEQQKAIPKLREEIETLILLLPLPKNTKEVSTYVSVLLHEITKRTADKEKENRTLTNALLDKLILDQGTEKDKWYSDVFAKWSPVEEVPLFRMGDFYEVIAATRHCRWHLHGSNHAEIWLKLLRLYIDLPETIVESRRKAIYEYLFLKMSSDMSSPKPTGSIEDEVEFIKYYFEHFGEHNSLADIEDDIALLQIVFTQWVLNPDFIDEGLITEWREVIENYINEQLTVPCDIDEKCLLYELKGSCVLHFDVGRAKAEKIDEALDVYRAIIPLLSETRLYTISRLSDLLGETIKVYIRFGVEHDTVIDAIETFLSEISDQATQTGKQHNEAHDLVERGITYLEKKGFKNFGRALDCFHKASDLWLLNDTKDGYLLSLFNIGQVYTSMGAALAGKYYGLCGIWSSFNFGDPRLLNRITDGYAIVFHTDFVQGAWISAMDDFLDFLNSRHLFVADGSTSNDLVIKSFIDLDLILETVDSIHPDLVHYVNFYKRRLGSFYIEEMEFLVAKIKTELTDQPDLRAFVRSKIYETPFSDVGLIRIIRFKMLGCEFQLLFENSLHLTAIAEEFGAFLQIALCEIALSSICVALPMGPVVIEISQSDLHFSAIEQADASPLRWRVKIPILNEHDPRKTNLHYAVLGTNIKYLITGISGKSSHEIESLFDVLYKKQKLGSKGLSSTGYQRAYLRSFSEEKFNASQRNNFRQIDGRFDRILANSLST
ncbi:hypothetical protein [Sphingobacterium hotanense]|uniref:hypothetical protein n=1 Tax=Sphingobacterium hotanense TaxID=649196 RepID=UPI0021A4A1C1|nr:hypothetical protein [Sphingobacterium hotanense]MCT1525655.1 hypothetical protein [Sphingobacterium hotanense]